MLTQTLPMVRTLFVRPIMGQNNFDPAEEISIHHSPDMNNCSVSRGMLVKRPGYTQMGSGSLDNPVVGLYSTQDDENNTYLYAVTYTSVYRWNSGTEVWDLLTGSALTGSSLTSVTFETSQNNVVFANGTDKVQLVSFSGATWATLNANCPIARYLTRFADRLYLGYTVEGATKPYRVRRSVAADHTNWTGTGSGFTDLSEFPHRIQNIKKLGTRMAVYTERSIQMATRTEIAAAPARFDITVTDTGLYSPLTLVGWKDEHMFLGNDDFYRFNGVQPTEMGLPVRDTIFSTINPGGLLRNFALPRYDTKEYIAFLCIGSVTVPNVVWTFNKERNIWYPWTVSGAKCGTSHRLDNTITIDELVGTIDDQNWEFDTRDLESQYMAMLTGHSDSKVYQWSTQYKSDAGVAIDCRWTSKDFTARDVDSNLTNNKVTLKSIAVSYLDQGADFDLSFSYSTDGGATWTSADVITFESANSTTKVLSKLVTHQASGNRVRFKIEQSSASEAFSLLSFHVDLEALSAPLYS